MRVYLLTVLHYLHYSFGAVTIPSYPDFPDQAKMTLSVDIKYKSNGQIASLKGKSLCLFVFSSHYHSHTSPSINIQASYFRLGFSLVAST